MLNAQALKVATQSAIRLNIMNEITKLADNGRFTGWFYHMPESVAIELESLGYKVEKTAFPDGHTEYNVSWE